MRDAHVGAQIAPDNHVMACGERALRSVVADCQRGRCCLTHRPNLSCLVQCTDCIGCAAQLAQIDTGGHDAGALYPLLQAVPARRW